MALERTCTRLPTPQAAWVHQIHTAGGASSSNTFLGNLFFLCGFWLATHLSDSSYLRFRGVTMWATVACTIPNNPSAFVHHRPQENHDARALFFVGGAPGLVSLAIYNDQGPVRTRTKKGSMTRRSRKAKSSESGLDTTARRTGWGWGGSGASRGGASRSAPWDMATSFRVHIFFLQRVLTEGQESFPDKNTSKREAKSRKCTPDMELVCRASPPPSPAPPLCRWVISSNEVA